jgi:hypothetical protein
MFTSVPDIFLDDTARPHKRQRLSPRTAVHQSNEVGAWCWESEAATQLDDAPPYVTAHTDICADTIVCFGMVSQVPSTLNEHPDIR